ncbi:hypothetical protein [Bradyrhizobium sp. 1(2017)]|uniref:hypothetical protein n=1 Tax=Bradyrhizobium sp. 1(2017) TaxID=1404888 RepID=UPI00140EA766|nr:hypothetical protein [Bradyrhizobium sp. 1(2017)]QIO32322.1 hypothetical protein HAP40_11000 [Bradyrhizobium sp. 1(2017)]
MLATKTLETHPADAHAAPQSTMGLGRTTFLGDVSDVTTLGGLINDTFGNRGFGGPWGFATLGGAGGQTIVGAFSTGTHGGDFDRPPIADSVQAIHLVVDGGKHYWIERVEGGVPQLTDDDALRDLYGPANGFEEIEIIRDNQTFDATVISVGRFGAIYSAILKAVPQYSLYERRRLDYWQDIKETIRELPAKLFEAPALNKDFKPAGTVFGPQRFLQIAVCLAPSANNTRNRVGITQRWTLSLTSRPPGREERVGALIDPGQPGEIDPEFERVGKGPGYSPDPNDPRKGAQPSLLEIACSRDSFLKGIIEGVANEIKVFVESDGAVVGAGIAATAAFGGVGLLALIPALGLILLALYAILDLIDDDTRFSEVMNTVKNRLLDPDNPDPLARAAGVFAWQMIYNKAFEGQQSPTDFEAISYAVMDKHHYGNYCEVNVDSVEVFFDAADTRLIAFVDALIAFEIAQEHHGKSMVGYASLRFTGPTSALIGMERFETNCAVEVACLRDVTGGQELIDFAVTLARNPNIGGILHWGQRNDCTRTDIDRLFGPTSGSDRIGAWREVLDRFTDGGQLNAFSNAFTRRIGLEP